MLLYFKNLNIYQKFIIISLIWNFYKNHFSKKKYYWYLKSKSALITTLSRLVSNVSLFSISLIASPNILISIQIWHFGLNYQRIRALVKVIHKKLKIIFVLEFKKLGLFFLMSKLGKFLFFDHSFLDLANF